MYVFVHVCPGWGALCGETETVEGQGGSSQVVELKAIQLGLEKQVLCRHETPERIELDNGTHFQNNLTDTWAREHGIDWGCHILYHALASGKMEWYNGVLKTILKAVGGGTSKHWDLHFSEN